MKAGKHYLYRAVVVQEVDRVFFEEGNRRRSHGRCHAAITHPLCGIGDETHRNYLRLPESELEAYELPRDLKLLLRLYANLRKQFSANDTARILGAVDRLIAFEQSRLRPLSGGRRAVGNLLPDALLGLISDRASE